MCGEHKAKLSAAVTQLGSSPHVRGARFFLDDDMRFRGIIPACAGSTIISCSTCRRLWDHPRMCGEHSPQRRGARAHRGSSPHVRGAQSAHKRVGQFRGIIPACAGSTIIRNLCNNCTGDHPRMCGEHGNGDCSLTLPAGSSPHVRGARANKAEASFQPGIIPACAGSTQFGVLEVRWVRDHPRMCGEHTSKIA